MSIVTTVIIIGSIAGDVLENVEVANVANKMTGIKVLEDTFVKDSGELNQLNVKEDFVRER